MKLIELGSVLTQFGGFVCEEGQAAADFKQLAATLLSAGIAIMFYRLAKRSTWHPKALSIITAVVGIIVTLAIAAIGPFFYSSWGCSNSIAEFFFPR